jgi:hypothetical protein
MGQARNFPQYQSNDHSISMINKLIFYNFTILSTTYYQELICISVRYKNIDTVINFDTANDIFSNRK